MRGSRVTYDRMWRFLCPALDRSALQRAVGLSRLSSLSSPVVCRPVRRAARPCLLQGRHYATTAAEPRQADQEARSADQGASWEERLLSPTPPSETTLREAPVDDVVAALMAMRDPRGWSFCGQDIDRHGRILQLVRHLVGARGQPASLFAYECMMDAMADPQGSAEGVRKLLDDLALLRMKPTEAMCQSALAALANHPDYTLRLEILSVMHEFWFTVDTPAKQNVALGLLRDGQYELAYARLTELMDHDARLDPWVYDIFILVFGKLGFLDEMLLLLQRRPNLGASDEVATTLLYHALDVCSQAFHHAGTVFAWNAVVRNPMLHPPSGIVENVLATAARHGDPALATEALDLISQRTRLPGYHYEAVAEAFAEGGDMAGALRVLCIMAEHGMRIVHGTTRVVHEALRRSPRLVEAAEAALARLQQGDKRLPMAVVSVVIEAKAMAQGSESAMDLYRDVPRLCGEQADAGMMQMLMVNSRDAETRRALARDYTARVAEDADPPRNPRVYNSLIPACAEAGELDLAFRFAVQAAAVCGTRRELAWVRPLVEAAAAREDGRIWGVVDALGKGHNAETVDMVQAMLHETRLAKREADLETRLAKQKASASRE